MSIHGKREAASRANATTWRDRVIDDARSGEGLAAARAREISVDLIIAVAEIIAMPSPPNPIPEPVSMFELERRLRGLEPGSVGHRDPVDPG